MASKVWGRIAVWVWGLVTWSRASWEKASMVISCEWRRKPFWIQALCYNEPVLRTMTKPTFFLNLRLWWELNSGNHCGTSRSLHKEMDGNTNQIVAVTEKNTGLMMVSRCLCLLMTFEKGAHPHKNKSIQNSWKI